jgi:hypothetical protein
MAGRVHRIALSRSRRPPSGRWYKGNTHAHTINSDGDSTPVDVATWYREHGYQFVVLTDHNVLTPVDGLNGLLGIEEQFLVIKGEEVTDPFGGKPLHINGLDVSGPQSRRRAAPRSPTCCSATWTRSGRRRACRTSIIRTSDGRSRARNCSRFEQPAVRDLQRSPDGQQPRRRRRAGMERSWDAILSNGTLLYGIAVDDAHTFKDPANPNVPAPGRGWVVVRAPRLEARALVDALERGDFYASTGVELADYQASARQITVAVKTTTFSKYRIQFIGKGGRCFAKVSSRPRPTRCAAMKAT